MTEGTMAGVVLPAYLRALASPMPSCSPESKYFFTRLLQIYGPRVTLGSTEELAQKFRVRTGVISRSVKELTNMEYLKKGRQVSGKRGRPKKSYECANPSEIGLAGKTNAFNELLIEALLSNDVEGRGEKSRIDLSFSKRLLLAVLLSCANSVGVVSEVGLAGLTALTGMGRERLKYQLGRLEGAGYLRPSVSGMTSTGLFGAACGVYFINLKHPVFGNARRSGVTFIFSGFRTPVVMGRGEADSILHWAGIVGRHPQKAEMSLELLKKALPCDDAFVGWAPLFVSGQLSTRVGRSFFQAKLNQYASFILTSHWGELKRGTPFAPPPALLSLIGLECFFPTRSAKRFQEITSESRRLLALFLFRVALRIAQGIHRMMDKLPDTPFDQMEHVILLHQSQDNALAITVDSYHRRGKHDSFCAVVDPFVSPRAESAQVQDAEEEDETSNALAKLGVRRLESESDLTKFEMLRYGLRRQK